MNTYSYAVARFVPDVGRNEPINVGIILNDPAGKRTHGKFIENFRTMRNRYPDSNISALCQILNLYRGEHEVRAVDPLSDLNRDSRFQLVFTELRAIKSETLQTAVWKLYDEFISIEPRLRRDGLSTQTKLKHTADTCIRTKLKDNWIFPNYQINGLTDSFKFHYAFKNGTVKDLFHVISFVSDPIESLIRSKALALTVKYMTDKQIHMPPTVLVHPPENEKHTKNYYDPALGYLEDQGCNIKRQEELEAYVTSIRKKLS